METQRSAYIDKPKRVYQLENASYARVSIDFKNKENPVRFDYPDLQAQWKNILLFVMYISLFPFIIFSVFIAIFAGLGQQSITYALIFIPLILMEVLFLIFVLSKKLQSKIPELNKRLSFRSIGLIEVNKLAEPKYEIPFFENVFLEYKATKEFGEYLEKIQVREYDFKYIQKRGLFKRKWKKVQQTDYWKAEFKFSQIPKTGELKIVFI